MWDDRAELERVWRASIVYIPDQIGGILETNVARLMSDDMKIDGQWPTVVFLHGCSGIRQDVYERMEFLAANGFAVIAPASYARVSYPRSCNPSSNNGGLYPDIVFLRMFDATHAVEQVKTFAWVDSEAVILGGHSEGAVVAALFEVRRPELRLAARIIESWTCAAEDFPRFEGLNAAPDEPVLALVNEYDPWLRRDTGFRGSCANFFHADSGSRSILYSISDPGPTHAPLRTPEAQRDTIEFLRQVLRM